MNLVVPPELYGTDPSWPCGPDHVGPRSCGIDPSQASRVAHEYYSYDTILNSLLECSNISPARPFSETRDPTSNLQKRHLAWTSSVEVI